ncbi:hypothetical protein [Providencia hangzhouensis]|uniref:hypothetical protein n=1 Tax=Providencia hangzhouensis TaxID=3031799 RepID=UPI0034DD454E
MERKKLTLKRVTTENVAESTEPVIQRRRKQVVINTQRKPNKLAKTAPTQPPKKVPPPPAKKQKAVVIPLEKSRSADTTKTTSAVRGGDGQYFSLLATEVVN